jgi:hypothetical protein
VRESQIDGNAPKLFFFQAVGIGSSQGLDKGALTMVDMARRPCDHMPHISPGAFSHQLSAKSKRKHSRTLNAESCFSRLTYRGGIYLNLMKAGSKKQEKQLSTISKKLRAES